MRRTFLFLAAATAIVSTSAPAQDFSRNPSFGTLNLSAGFADDPRVVNVTAGGQRSANGLGDGCVGSIANSPDVRVNYQAGSFPLIFSVVSDQDTTLVINGPDGRWYCNDDTNGVNPIVRFSPAGSGQYDVYIGHYGTGSHIPARLYVSEVSAGGGE
jgi:hypothetical protein